MTKTQTLCLLLLGLGSMAFAQRNTSVLVPEPVKLEKAPYAKIYALPEQYTPDAPLPAPMQAGHASDRGGFPEQLVSLTRWDAQGYGCATQRTWADNAGYQVATWIFATDDSGVFPERGTGYSVDDNGTWSNATARIETIRTGFPAATRLADGTEIVVSHTTAFTPYRLLVSRKAPGTSTWTESFLDNPPGAGCLWPHIATDGQNVHVVAITTPVANTGTVYQGIDGHVLYWRSTDGGVSWDKKASIIPGLDNSQFAIFSADAYTVDANGGVVAVGVFPDWNDLQIFKSWDNGDNWETTVVNDFPDVLENYSGAAGQSYTFDDIGYYDENAPDSLAVFSSDGFGVVMVDGAGQAHVWFGRMYYVDTDSNAGTFYYPGINGLVYWKESTAAMNVITGALDYDGDSTLNISSIAEIGPYYNSLSSFATVGTDDNGNIFLCYAALHELFRSDWSGAEVDQFYRHLYIMWSADFGDNWSEPFEVSRVPYMDEFTAPFAECVWPSLPRHVGDDICLIYQQDVLPGTDLWGDNHTSYDNGIYAVCVPRDSLPGAIIGTLDQDASLDFRVSPNPADQIIQITAAFEGAEQAPEAVLYDVFGRKLASYRFQRGSGPQTVTAPVGHLPAGMYVLRVREGNRSGTTKLVIK